MANYELKTRSRKPTLNFIRFRPVTKLIANRPSSVTTIIDLYAYVITQDNPLSALDNDVSQHVLFNGIKKSTLNQIKTIVMTTSFASDLSFADTVYTARFYYRVIL